MFQASQVSMLLPGQHHNPNPLSGLYARNPQIVVNAFGRTYGLHGRDFDMLTVCTVWLRHLLLDLGEWSAAGARKTLGIQDVPSSGSIFVSWHTSREYQIDSKQQECDSIKSNCDRHYYMDKEVHEQPSYLRAQPKYIHLACPSPGPS